MNTRTAPLLEAWLAPGGWRRELGGMTRTVTRRTPDGAEIIRAALASGWRVVSRTRNRVAFGVADFREEWDAGTVYWYATPREYRGGGPAPWFFVLSLIIVVPQNNSNKSVDTTTTTG